MAKNEKNLKGDMAPNKDDPFALPDNLDALSNEELEGIKQNMETERERLRELKHAIAIVQQGKVSDWHVQQATETVERFAKEEGRTPEEQANYWLSQQYGDPGKHIMARRFLEQRLVNSRDL
jgi:hypothetical protein